MTRPWGKNCATNRDRDREGRLKERKKERKGRGKDIIRLEGTKRETIKQERVMGIGEDGREERERGREGGERGRMEAKGKGTEYKGRELGVRE